MQKTENYVGLEIQGKKRRRRRESGFRCGDLNETLAAEKPTNTLALWPNPCRVIMRESVNVRRECVSLCVYLLIRFIQLHNDNTPSYLHTLHRLLEFASDFEGKINML